MWKDGEDLYASVDGVTYRYDAEVTTWVATVAHSQLCLFSEDAR